jgi:hypothetical protein
MLDGRALATQLRDDLRQRVERLAADAAGAPRLAILGDGANEGAALYAASLDRAEAQNVEGVLAISADGVRVNKIFVVKEVLGRFRSRNLRAFDGSRQEHSVSPDNWRRMRATIDRGLPLDVFVWSPFRREVFLV